MDGFDSEGEAEKARAVLLFGNGPNRVRRASIFHHRFPIISGVCFVRTSGRVRVGLPVRSGPLVTVLRVWRFPYPCGWVCHVREPGTV